MADKTKPIAIVGTAGGVNVFAPYGQYLPLRAPFAQGLMNLGQSFEDVGKVEKANEALARQREIDRRTLEGINKLEELDIQVTNARTADEVLGYSGKPKEIYDAATVGIDTNTGNLKQDQLNQDVIVAIQTNLARASGSSQLRISSKHLSLGAQEQEQNLKQYISTYERLLHTGETKRADEVRGIIQDNLKSGVEKGIYSPEYAKGLGEELDVRKGFVYQLGLQDAQLAEAMPEVSPTNFQAALGIYKNYERFREVFPLLGQKEYAQGKTLLEHRRIAWEKENGGDYDAAKAQAALTMDVLQRAQAATVEGVVVDTESLRTQVDLTKKALEANPKSDKLGSIARDLETGLARIEAQQKARTSPISLEEAKRVVSGISGADLKDPKKFGMALEAAASIEAYQKSRQAIDKGAGFEVLTGRFNTQPKPLEERGEQLGDFERRTGANAKYPAFLTSPEVQQYSELLVNGSNDSALIWRELGGLRGLDAKERAIAGQQLSSYIKKEYDGTNILAGVLPMALELGDDEGGIARKLIAGAKTLQTVFKGNLPSSINLSLAKYETAFRGGDGETPDNVGFTNFTTQAAALAAANAGSIDAATYTTGGLRPGLLKEAAEALLGGGIRSGDYYWRLGPKAARVAQGSISGLEDYFDNLRDTGKWLKSEGGIANGMAKYEGGKGTEIPIEDILSGPWGGHGDRRMIPIGPDQYEVWYRRADKSWEPFVVDENHNLVLDFQGVGYAR